VLPSPFGNEASDSQIVQLQHHYMAIAMDFGLFVPQEVILDVCLSEILRLALTILSVIGRLGCENENGNALKVGKFTGGLSLLPAFNQVQRIGFPLLIFIQFRRTGH
jgi:hypothetical protein